MSELLIFNGNKANGRSYLIFPLVQVMVAVTVVLLIQQVISLKIIDMIILALMAAEVFCFLVGFKKETPSKKVVF